MTPWQAFCVVEKYSEQKKAAAEWDLLLLWRAEILQRMKTVPTFKEFLHGPEKRPGVNESSIKAQLQAYQKGVKK